MSSASGAASQDGLDRKVFRDFFALTLGWWTGPTARNAWFLTAALAGCLVINVGINFAVNTWNRRFFDALEATDTNTVFWAVIVFLGLVFCAAAVGVGIVLSRETLQVRWRAWLVGSILDRWIGGQRYYRMGLARTEPANPEYRIADDTRMATEPIVDFAIGLLSSVISALTFVGVLWVVGGSLTVPVGGSTFVIPGYMVLAAIVYGVTVSALMLWVGRKLPGAVARRNEGEAKLRFELTRLRENAESVALIRGEADERRLLGTTYADLVTRLARRGAAAWPHHLADQFQRCVHPGPAAAARRAEISLRRVHAGTGHAAGRCLHAGPDRHRLAGRQLQGGGPVLRLDAARHRPDQCR
ncbi:SbmA/BacA-like family transporter [Phreatobacter sp.]|uniref:SbmA/BacA-like family transporter n=1 Tax=Phreatobacter sp. TaxID=1966341 RepID=UPI003F72FBFA